MIDGAIRDQVDEAVTGSCDRPDPPTAIPRPLRLAEAQDATEPGSVRGEDDVPIRDDVGDGACTHPRVDEGLGRVQEELMGPAGLAAEALGDHLEVEVVEHDGVLGTERVGDDRQ